VHATLLALPSSQGERNNTGERRERGWPVTCAWRAGRSASPYTNQDDRLTWLATLPRDVAGHPSYGKTRAPPAVIPNGRNRRLLQRTQWRATETLYRAGRPRAGGRRETVRRARRRRARPAHRPTCRGGWRRPRLWLSRSPSGAAGPRRSGWQIGGAPDRLSRDAGCRLSLRRAT